MCRGNPSTVRAPVAGLVERALGGVHSASNAYTQAAIDRMVETIGAGLTRLYESRAG